MKLRSVSIYVLLAALGLLSLWGVEGLVGKRQAPALMPLPSKVETASGGGFVLGTDTQILADPRSSASAEYLAKQLRKPTGLAVPVKVDSAAKPAKGCILLSTGHAMAGSGSGAEGYQLKVTRARLSIDSADPAGMFYGVQTLLQLLPSEIFAPEKQSIEWRIPAVNIEDHPRFGWRGFLLDVARHFFTVGEVKQLLDAMALHKLNVLQLHLTDDQGWRLEIKKYPRLTEVGAWRKDVGFNLDPKSSTAYGPDGRYGGYYTQEDIRDLVAYAAERHITIVPEIEMPGHASAALAAYPQFSCSGGPYSTDVGGGVFAGVYCAGNDGTFEFLQNVLAEVIALFPGKCIHIGGDEVPKQNWKNCAKCQERMKQEGLKSERELQSYFVRRMEKFINSQGRTLIGWSEIAEGGLAQNAVVMDWIGGAVEAASAGHDVVMTPTGYCYLDYYQSTNSPGEPRAIGGFLPLRQVYSFEPIPEGLDRMFQGHILGVQGNLWTEYIPSLRHAEYMAFPRLCALAEVGWSSPAGRDYSEFKRRLATHAQRLERMGVNYRKASVTD